jgi:glycosyltransferase involved in cell wall biosynthesis
LKITIISPAFPHPNPGILFGIERYTENIAIHLKNLGNKVNIITTFWNGGKKFDNYKGIPILRILDSRALFGKYGTFYFLDYISFGFNIIRKIRNHKFYSNSDVIIFTAPIGFTYFFHFIKIPSISIFHHYEPYPYPSLHYITKRQFNRQDNIITISKQSKNQIITHFGTDKEKITIIPNGVDIKKFNPSNQSEEIRNKYGHDILLFSGLMVPRKNVPVLLKAMPQVIKEFPDVHLLLTGEGYALDDYKILSKSLGIQNNVDFLGYIDDEYLTKLYATSDIFVFPSALEGFGQVLLEAMASGTPVICTDKPPMSKIIGNGGITFKLNDSKDLAEKIIELLMNRDELKKLKKNSQIIAKKYDWDHIAYLYLKYINDMCK